MKGSTRSLDNGSDCVLEEGTSEDELAGLVMPA